MTKKFSTLRSKMSPSAQAQSAPRAEGMLNEVPLNSWRQSRAQRRGEQAGMILNEETVAAMKDARNGKVTGFATVDDLMLALKASD